jgi:hypothetical protein
MRSCQKHQPRPPPLPPAVKRTGSASSFSRALRVDLLLGWSGKQSSSHQHAGSYAKKPHHKLAAGIVNPSFQLCKLRLREHK